MSLLFRVFVVSKKAQRLNFNAISSKFNFDSLLFNGIGCNCKVSENFFNIIIKKIFLLKINFNECIFIIIQLPKIKSSYTGETLFLRDYSTEAKANTTLIETETKTNINFTETPSSEKEKNIEVIYNGLLAKPIKRLKLLTLTTSWFGLSVQPLLYNKVLEAGQVTPITLPLFGFIAFLALFTPIAIHYISKRYIICVEYDHKNDKYIATNYSFLSFKNKVCIYYNRDYYFYT